MDDPKTKTYQIVVIREYTILVEAKNSHDAKDIAIKAAQSDDGYDFDCDFISDEIVGTRQEITR